MKKSVLLSILICSFSLKSMEKVVVKKPLKKESAFFPFQKLPVEIRAEIIKQVLLLSLAHTPKDDFRTYFALSLFSHHKLFPQQLSFNNVLVNWKDFFYYKAPWRTQPHWKEVLHCDMLPKELQKKLINVNRITLCPHAEKIALITRNGWDLWTLKIDDNYDNKVTQITDNPNFLNHSHISFNKEGNLYAFLENKRGSTVKIYDSGTDRLLTEIPSESQIYSCTFFNQLLVISKGNPTSTLYFYAPNKDFTDWKEVARIAQDTNIVIRCLHPTQRKLFAGGSENRLFVITPHKKKPFTYTTTPLCQIRLQSTEDFLCYIHATKDLIGCSSYHVGTPQQKYIYYPKSKYLYKVPSFPLAQTGQSTFLFQDLFTKQPLEDGRFKAKNKFFLPEIKRGMAASYNFVRYPNGLVHCIFREFQTSSSSPTKKLKRIVISDFSENPLLNRIITESLFKHMDYKKLEKLKEEVDPILKRYITDRLNREKSTRLK